MARVSNCALCGEAPSFEHKFVRHSVKALEGNYSRLVCRNKKCAGHEGRWNFSALKSIEVWNTSQASKASTIRRMKNTEALA